MIIAADVGRFVKGASLTVDDEYRVEIRGARGDVSQTGWGPGIAGALNRTGRSDDEASTFRDAASAMEAVERLIRVHAPDAIRIVKNGVVVLFLWERGVGPRSE